MSTSISDKLKKTRHFVWVAIWCVVFFVLVLPLTMWLVQALLQTFHMWPEQAGPVNVFKPILIGLPIAAFFIYSRLQNASRKIIVVFLLRFTVVLGLLSVLSDAFFNIGG